MKNLAPIGLFAICALALALPLQAQNAPPDNAAPGAGAPAGRGRGGRAPAYPPRVTNADMVERGRVLFNDNNCASCHADDIRGTDRGPSLLRSQLVQRDQMGELIAPIIRNGATGMPATATLSDTQIADIAEFLHDFEINSRDPARMRPDTIVTGDATRGQAYFAANCSGCHSVTGDFAGLASKYSDPRTLQTRYLSPQTSQPTMVAVTQADGARTEGQLVNIDEFLVTIKLTDGTTRTFSRRGSAPAVTVNDPLQAHNDMLRKYTDQDIHDLTAYLVTLK